MARTPDRSPGPSDEEETIYEVNNAPVGGPGSVSFDGTTFKLQDAAGFYDPRIGSSAIDVKDEGVVVPSTPHVSLNFTGLGVTVTDAGGGIADVSIPAASLPIPTDVGQFLYSYDGLMFSPARPLMNDDGIVQVDDSDRLIVGGA